MARDYHLSLNLSRELWHELLGAALPMTLSEGQVDLVDNARAVVKQLQVRERVAGLLEDQRAPSALRRARDRARGLWRNNRERVYRRLNEVMRVEGRWTVSLDEVGTRLKYGSQKLGADATVKGRFEGRLVLLNENVEIPIVLEKRVGATVALENIRYDPEHEAVIGSLGDLGVHIGDRAVYQLVSRLAEYVLEQQLPRTGPVPILKRAQVAELVQPMGGALKMQMGVEDLELTINEDDATLNVRFGFAHAQVAEVDHG